MISPREIKDRRKAMGLTQIELAQRAGVSVPTYRLWEAGGTKPNKENEKRLIEALNGGGTHGSSKK